MKDKIEIKESFFIQIIVSLLMSFAFLRNIVYGLWAIPIMAILVIVFNMYFNAIMVGYKLRAKALKLQWCFFTPVFFDMHLKEGIAFWKKPSTGM